MPNQSGGDRFAYVWLIALIFTILTIVAHIYSPSTWSLSDAQWEQTLSMHRDSAVFQVRPLTTTIITFLHDTVGISIKWGFFGLQFFLFFLCGPAFYYYLRQLQLEGRLAMAGMILWLFSLPLFMAHFEPIFTWSDFWVYLFVPLSIAAARRGSMVLSTLFMIVALLARETTLLFVPFLVFLFYRRDTPDTRRGIAVATLSISLFLALRYTLVGAHSPSPDFKLWFNLAGGRIRDTFFSLYVSLGFVWVLGLISAWRNVSSHVRIPRVLSWGGLLVSAGLLSSGLVFGQARETRLFAPAAIFLIPLSLYYLRAHLTPIRAAICRLLSHTWQQIIALALLLAISVAIGKLLVPHFDYRRWQDGNWLYLGIHIAASLVVVWYELYPRHAGTSVHE